MPVRRRWMTAAVLVAVVAMAAPAGAGPGGPARGVSALRALRSAPACARPVAGVNYYAPGGPGKTVALTFDDGPGPSTPALLRILHSEHVTATFFNLGVGEIRYPDLVRAEASAGYALGDHTWDHPVLPQLSRSGQADQMRREAAEQALILGGRPCLFRPPYGSYDTATLAASAAAGMSLWNWSVDTEDWKAQGSAAQSWVRRIIARAEAGVTQRHPVILMHNQATPNPATVAAVRPVIDFYRAHGFRFVDLFGRSWQPAPTAEARTAGGLHEVRTGDDGVVEQRLRRPEAGWSAWRRIGSGFVDAPAVVATGPSSIVVVARRRDGVLAVRRLSDGGTTSRWRSLGGTWAGRPAAAVGAGGVLSVVVRGVDDQVWLRRRVSGHWAAWRSLGGHVIRAPAVAATADGLLVVGVDSRGVLLARRLSRGGWGSWQRLGATAGSDPAMVTLPTGLVLLAARTPDGRIGMRTWQAGVGWSRMRDLAGRVESAPTMTVDRGAVRLVADRPVDRPEQDVSTSAPTGWSGWRPV